MPIQSIAQSGDNSKNVCYTTISEASAFLGQCLKNDTTRAKLKETCSEMAYRYLLLSKNEHGGAIFWNDPDRELPATQAILGPFYKARDIAADKATNKKERVRIINQLNQWIGRIRSECARFANAERTEDKSGQVVWSNLPDAMWQRVNKAGNPETVNDVPVVDPVKDARLRKVHFPDQDEIDRKESLATSKKYGRLKVLSTAQENARRDNKKLKLSEWLGQNAKAHAKKFHTAISANWGECSSEDVRVYTEHYMAIAKRFMGAEAFAVWKKALDEEKDV